jgi:ATP-dependent exoDNAse (exonuclease V) alpha subunit
LNCSRKQYPLTLAYAISIHRSHGVTLENAVVEIGLNEFTLGITYVGCSSVKKIDGLLLEPSFNSDRLIKINSKKGFDLKRQELRRLEALQ